MKTRTPVIDQNGRARSGRLVAWLSRHWVLLLSLALGIWVGLPWLAPLFMKLGWTTAADVIYFLYGWQCHQLPQRSFFLFGEKSMYSLAEIQAVWQVTNNPLILRQFVGNPEMGWKVAWSDRMVSLYGGIFLFTLFYRLLPGQSWPTLSPAKWPLPVWALGLLLLPLFADGVTHMVSDLQGMGSGFRDSNAWLATLSGNRFPAQFYTGAALGSFNSWMRLITGALAALGLVWFAFSHLDTGYDNTGQTGTSL